MFQEPQFFKTRFQNEKTLKRYNVLVWTQIFENTDVIAHL